MNKIIIICGPTCSGKTALSVEIARLLDSEIISADSMNVYKGLNIGTAKPTIEEMQGIKHHLIDVVEPDKIFSVGDYRELAMPIVKRLHSEKKIPVICGGTGFYINSLLYNFSYGNAVSNFSAREKYFNLAKECGNEYVFDILKEKDFESAKKLHPNDLKRVVRALEIYESGNLKSKLNDSLEPIFEYEAFSFDYDRDALYKRIDRRVDDMISNGLVDEVNNLKSNGITLENQCMQGIGYKEVYSYLEGEYSLSDMIDKIKLNTRHYAKRQITFFKKLKNLKLIKPDDLKEVAKRIIRND